ncbi:Uncharacterised protein [Mycobacteroides abscessus]|nr:Uncharacterised protein [Mycobacteroides abscessus]
MTRGMSSLHVARPSVSTASNSGPMSSQISGHTARTGAPSALGCLSVPSMSRYPSL